MKYVKLVFLGVGGWISKPLLGHTSILVEESSWKLLLDAGDGVYKSLFLYGGWLSGLRGIVVTHMHGDHVLGLPTIVMHLKHSGVRGVKVYAPREALGDLDLLLRIVGVDYSGVIDILGVSDGDACTLEPFTLKFTRANHTTPALSVRVESSGKCFAYSGDTSYSPRLVELSRGCEVLVHEASGYDPTAHVHGHSTVEDAVRVALESGVEKLVLVHYYMDQPHLERLEAPKGLKVYLAYPGMELEV